MTLKFQKCTKTSNNIPKCLKTFQNWTKIVPKHLITSQNISKCPKMSKNVSNVSKVPKHSKMSWNVPTVNSRRIRPDQNRTEQNRTEQNRTDKTFIWTFLGHSEFGSGFLGFVFVNIHISFYFTITTNTLKHSSIIKNFFSIFFLLDCTYILLLPILATVWSFFIVVETILSFCII